MRIEGRNNERTKEEYIYTRFYGFEINIGNNKEGLS